MEEEDKKQDELSSNSLVNQMGELEVNSDPDIPPHVMEVINVLGLTTQAIWDAGLDTSIL